MLAERDVDIGVGVLMANRLHELQVSVLNSRCSNCGVFEAGTA